MPKITNFHPDGTEFLPEKFTIPADNEQGSRIYYLIARIAEEISRSERSADPVT